MTDGFNRLRSLATYQESARGIALGAGTEWKEGDPVEVWFVTEKKKDK